MKTAPDAPQVLYLSPAEMEPWPELNPRRRFDEEKLTELTESVRQHGVLQPIVVHDRNPEGEHAGGPALVGHRYWIVAGETRWRAATAASLDQIPAVVRVFTEGEALKIALLENLHRNALSPIEEARGFQRWLELNPGVTQEAVAAEVNRSQAYVSNRLRLLRLPDVALELIEEGLLDPSAARDYLVPFAQIPEEKRKKLFRAVAKRIRDLRERWGDEVRTTQIRDAVAKEAVKLSHPVYATEVVYGIDREDPLFDPELHQKCRCQGPRFNYLGYGPSNHARCFDDAWWTAAQREAREAAEARAKEAAAKLKDSGGGVRTMTYHAFVTEHGYSCTPIDTERGLLDAEVLAGAELVVVTGASGPSVYCLDDAAEKRARSVVTRERNEMVAERKAARGREDLARVSGMALEPWMLAELLVSRPTTDTMMHVGRELGFDMGKHGEIEAAIRRLPADQLEALYKVLAIRSKEKRLSFFAYGNPDPIEKEVDAILRRKYGPGMKQLARRALEAAAIDAPPEETPAEFAEAIATLRAAMDRVPRDVPQADLPIAVLIPVARAYVRVERVLGAAPELEEQLAGDNEQLLEDAHSLAMGGPEIEDETDCACIHCGCTDSNACDGGCSWLVVDRDRGLGVCTSCAEDEQAAAEALAHAA